MDQDTKKPKKDTALRDHIKARITRKPNRIIKRSFIEAAMCNHNIVILLMGMLVFVGMLGICIMPKQEMPQFTPPGCLRSYISGCYVRRGGRACGKAFGEFHLRIQGGE